jgi:hypothetical protein
VETYGKVEREVGVGVFHYFATSALKHEAYIQHTSDFLKSDCSQKVHMLYKITRLISDFFVAAILSFLIGGLQGCFPIEYKLRHKIK